MEMIKLHNLGGELEFMHKSVYGRPPDKNQFYQEANNENK